MTTEILQHMGLTVYHVTTAELGLRTFNAHHYDLVLLDIILAGEKNGIAFIEEVRARKDEKNSVPILAISSLINAQQRIHALKVGANDFITKPIMQAELTVRVKNLITSQQLLQQVIQQTKDLELLAMTDQLTGLYNRYYLQLSVVKTLREVKRHETPLSVVMIDLDKFKPINDTFGHEQGDEVLVKIAETLTNNARFEDSVIRLGGDEFLLVLPHCKLTQAKEKAENLCLAFAQLSFENSEVSISASFGVASTEQGEFDFKKLLALADEAAYQSKALGGNTVHSTP